ncbi:UPF0187-domain-containing protein [Basidiobolus meristosporus CBS 931.73]|uniref:UPF0187-domain-containing protein n=1 Tax=Basidiobolus meristosporus CBS 931.73 TaxID=1314790 RepID=A0A1Y1XHI3_9FUNG|nr:UPF0187-domain-containing protein [Basidiobolus meristosporus CBS 931.73]|eukprot:ORX84856.1 UPF0187-domain-containing protein [Basidiobolus meristosporus CBS 931.73]
MEPYPKKRFLVYPDVFRFKGSVLPAIFPHIVAITAFTWLIVYLYEVRKIQLALPNAIVPSLSVVVGLLLVFRTNTAYDRYYEGRRLWTSLRTSIRNIIRQFWIEVVEEDTTDQKEKDQAIKLLLAFALATKHHLRGENDTPHLELEELLPLELQFTSRLRYKATYATNNLSHYRSSVEIDSETGINLPLEIAFYVSMYIQKQFKSKKIEGPQNTVLSNALSGIVDCFGGLERILRTPIPMAYNIHLQQCLYAYCGALPFTLVKELHWLTIPMVCIVAFMLFGIDGIGAEIENPFGYDLNDLPIDDFCDELRREADYIVARVPKRQSNLGETLIQ